MLAQIRINENYIKENPGELPFNKQWYSNIEKYFWGLNKPIILELQYPGYWFEYKILEEFVSIFVHAFEIDTKVTYQTAINLTEISKVFRENEDVVLLNYIIRFFNTLLKISITKRDTQNALYVCYQYYLTCQVLIDHLANKNDSSVKRLVENIAKYFKFYGQLGEQKRIEKVLEYSAYFLRRLNEKVYEQLKIADSRFPESVLKIFLTVDDVPRQKSNKEALLGVRQHQAILASYYMETATEEFDPDDLLEMIYYDMKDETVERLCEIVNSILEVNQEKPFEVDNLGENLIFIRQKQKEKLIIFFNRFKGVKFNGQHFEKPG